MRRIRQVSEAEAIAEFLRNEFYESEFDRDRTKFEEVVLHPNLQDEYENALRRALLFRRRGHMWRELPEDTRWYEVEIEPADVERIRVFPRSHWSRLSQESYQLSHIVEQIRRRRSVVLAARAIRKIQQFRDRLLAGECSHSTVILIGLDELNPLTVLEGNHRLAAAMLVSPALPRHFRVLCGYSARMRECCWYQTTVSNLWRYLKNRLTHIVDGEASVERVMAQHPTQKPAESTAASALESPWR